MHLLWMYSYSLLVFPEAVPPEVIEALEGHSDVLARLLVLWTALVVIGLMMEYGAEFAKWKPANVKHPRSFAWIRWWSKLGPILVVGGVAGEMFIASSAFRVETDLRGKNHQNEAWLMNEAVDAKKSAEAERLKRVELEATLAWRRLTPKDKARFSKLNHFNDTPLAVCCNAGDGEGINFAWEFAAMAHTHKWTVLSPANNLDFLEPGHPFGSVPRPKFGIEVASSENPGSQEVAKAIAGYFVDRGFDAEFSPRLSKSTNPRVIVTMGTRPQGAQGEAKLRHEAEAKTQNK